MDRNTRILQHTKSEIKPLTEQVPNVNAMNEGEERWIFVSGVLRKYVKIRGQLFYIQATKA